MLRWMRVGALVAAVVTALLLVLGDHPPEFVVADAILVVALVAAAAVPVSLGPMPWLVAAFGFSAGVFTVAFARSFSETGINVPVGFAAVACTVALAAGAWTLRRA